MYYVGSMDLGGPYGAPQDALTLWKFDVDFAVPANSTFALAHTLPVAAFDSIFPCTPTARNCIPQPGTAVKLDILSYRQRPCIAWLTATSERTKSLVDEPVGGGGRRHRRHPLV